MNYAKYSTLFLLIFIASTSCEKGFLEVSDNRDLNRSGYVTDLRTMGHYLNGIYILLNKSFEQGIGAAYPELAADNLKPLSNGDQSLIAHYTWSQKANEGEELSVISSSLGMNGQWKGGGYFIIRACNFVIEDVDKYRAEDPAKADYMKGQAYALRALLHFKLVNIFAQSYNFTPGASHPGIPYITTSDVTEPFSRQTVAEVYNKVIEDFKNAEQLLPPTTTNTRFINRAAVKGLLARVHLFKEDYQEAKKLADELINQFPLISIQNGYPDKVFMNTSPAETETLFQLTPMDALETSLFIGFYLSGNYILFNATNDIASILRENPNDARINWVTMVDNEWQVSKFPKGIAVENPPIPSTIAEIGYYPPVVRTSEMVLICAEASAKLNNEESARDYLDEIRKRADPSIAPVTATGQALLDSIYKERRKELAFEGFRMYDLQRWKLGVQRIDVNPLYPTSTQLPYPSEKAIAPIPMQDVRLAGIPQNQGY